MDRSMDRSTEHHGGKEWTIHLKARASGVAWPCGWCSVAISTGTAVGDFILNVQDGITGPLRGVRAATICLARTVQDLTKNEKTQPSPHLTSPQPPQPRPQERSGQGTFLRDSMVHVSSGVLAFCRCPCACCYAPQPAQIRAETLPTPSTWRCLDNVS